MIECFALQIPVGIFDVHFLKGKNRHLLVFVPGFMEPRFGFFNIWSEMAYYFHEKGYSCLLFDLAGQGESCFPLSFNIWNQQRNAILQQFADYKVHFVARGIGTVFLSTNQIHIAINPSLLESVAKQFEHIRWKPSPSCNDCLVLAEPYALLDVEKECFHRLGVPMENICTLQLPASFVKDLPKRLPSKLPDNILCYETEENRSILGMRSQRDALRRLIENDLAMNLS